VALTAVFGCLRFRCALLLVDSALKAIESHRLKKGALLSKNAVANDVTGDPVAQILTKYNLDNQAWDNLSHFVLRLAYCKVRTYTCTQMLLDATGLSGV